MRFGLGSTHRNRSYRRRLNWVGGFPWPTIRWISGGLLWMGAAANVCCRKTCRPLSRPWIRVQRIHLSRWSISPCLAASIGTRWPDAERAARFTPRSSPRVGTSSHSSAAAASPRAGETQISVAQIGPIKTRLAEVRALQLRSLQVCILQLGVNEIDVCQMALPAILCLE